MTYTGNQITTSNSGSYPTFTPNSYCLIQDLGSNGALSFQIEGPYSGQLEIFGSISGKTSVQYSDSEIFSLSGVPGAIPYGGTGIYSINAVDGQVLICATSLNSGSVLVTPTFTPGQFISLSNNLSNVLVTNALSLASGSYVNLGTNNYVGLISGSSITINPGTTVALAPGATVGLTSGSTVTLNGTVQVNASLASGSTVSLSGTAQVNASLASGSGVSLLANALGVPSFYQVKINSTNSGVRLPNIPATNGVSVTAHPLNSQPASVGGTIGTSGVNNITNGSGNGSILIPGTQKGYPVTNSNLLYVNGVAGDIFFVEVY